MVTYNKNCDRKIPNYIVNKKPYLAMGQIHWQWQIRALETWVLRIVSFKNATRLNSKTGGQGHGGQSIIKNFLSWGFCSDSYLTTWMHSWLLLLYNLPKFTPFFVKKQELSIKLTQQPITSPVVNVGPYIWPWPEQQNELPSSPW